MPYTKLKNFYLEFLFLQKNKCFAFCGSPTKIKRNLNELNCNK